MTIATDTALWHCAHQRRCLELNRCVCGHDRRRDEDFDAQLKRAMEKPPEHSACSDCPMRTQCAIRGCAMRIFELELATKTTGVADSDGGECD